MRRRMLLRTTTVGDFLILTSQIGHTANLRTEILDFRGFDSSRVLILRGGILMSIGSPWGIPRKV